MSTDYLIDRFGNKNDAEKLVLAFEFGAELDTGESLTGTPTVTITVLTGTDAAPNDVKNGDPAIVGTDVLLPVKGGIVGVDYQIEVVCATSNSNKVLARIGKLYIEA